MAADNIPAAFVRELLPQLELCRFSIMGAGDEYLHFLR
jgi:hypothetical protein